LLHLTCDSNHAPVTSRLAKSNAPAVLLEGEGNVAGTQELTVRRDEDVAEWLAELRRP
jgi:hypothetical protein